MKYYQLNLENRVREKASQKIAFIDALCAKIFYST